ncbi:MAG: DUF1365 family protein [Phaeovulum sp.]|uniref:DUF1365 family protein n=1 Tax=Phaeovulum sp. TaxID=2934796 RepID=UPI0027345145|nr:DUF1365 family protein [Phaeovulum sp.]MDP3861332.1 DUF1365 family protein [Phaeovulum sp.]
MPFPEVAGRYWFCFACTAERVNICLFHGAGSEGVVATLVVRPRAARKPRLIGAALRRPLGPGRMVALIHWQALTLWLKGSRYHRHPLPPKEEVS